jgi:hypothetical protein
MAGLRCRLGVAAGRHLHVIDCVDVTGLDVHVCPPWHQHLVLAPLVMTGCAWMPMSVQQTAGAVSKAAGCCNATDATSSAWVQNESTSSEDFSIIRTRQKGQIVLHGCRHGSTDSWAVPMGHRPHLQRLLHRRRVLEDNHILGAKQVVQVGVPQQGSYSIYGLWAARHRCCCA